jgi:hypothetical protein
VPASTNRSKGLAFAALKTACAARKDAALLEHTNQWTGWQCRINFNQKIKNMVMLTLRCKTNNTKKIVLCTHQSYFQVQMNAPDDFEKKGSYQWVDIS